LLVPETPASRRPAESASRGNDTAASCAGWTSVPPPNPGSGNVLNAVAVLSASNVWAVGSYDPVNGDPTTQLVEHWDGSQWNELGLGRGVLTDVAAISRTNMWVVGYSFSPGFHTVVEHWDGTVWKTVTIPRHIGGLNGVAAISAANIWTVGGVILHWNGTAWKKIAIPSPGGFLYAVAASSLTHVWAVGSIDFDETLAIHHCSRNCAARRLAAARAAGRWLPRWQLVRQRHKRGMPKADAARLSHLLPATTASPVMPPDNQR